MPDRPSSLHILRRSARSYLNVCFYTIWHYCIRITDVACSMLHWCKTPLRWLLLKNGYVPQKFFSPFSPKMLLFSKKLLNEKIFKTSFPIKKVIFIFVSRRPIPFKRDLAPRNGFLLFFFSRKYSFFWKNS